MRLLFLRLFLAAFIRNLAFFFVGRVFLDAGGISLATAFIGIIGGHGLG